MNIQPQILERDLAAIRDQLGKSPILLHTDLLQMGLIADPLDRFSFCAAYERVLEKVLGTQTYLIPTFNYEYCRSGLYDVRSSPSEVGALTDYYRQQYPECRTHTPVFHFCIRHNQAFRLNTHQSCFDAASTFGELAEAEGAVLFLGAPLSANTFVHHAEELCDVPYRFHKLFPGQVLWNNTSTPTQLTYRVRPLTDSRPYAWGRIEGELLAQGLLQEAPIGKGRALFFRAHELRHYWMRQLSKDPHALLL